jgi:hypothetical protein
VQWAAAVAEASMQLPVYLVSVVSGHGNGTELCVAGGWLVSQLPPSAVMWGAWVPGCPRDCGASVAAGVVFEWNLGRVAAFDAIKQALVSAPCLAAPRWDLDFILTTDWSCAAIGAVLSEIDPMTGLEHPVAFASRALTATERNYAPTEGECLAVKWAVEKYRYYLHERKFQLRVDHQALVWLDSARFSNSKLERWALALQEYDYTVEYIKGETNVVADHLSRSCAVVVSCCAYAQAKVPCVPRRQCQAMRALVPWARLCAAWPDQAAKQSELDAVPCDVCGHAGLTTW